MNTSFIFNRFVRSDHLRLYILSALWLLGLVLGMALGIATGGSGTQQLYIGLLCEPSLLPLVFLVAFPLIITGFALRFRLFTLTLPLLFIMSILRGFCCMFLFVQLGSGAWLLRCLYMFSGGCTSVLMWWLLFRHGVLPKPSLKTDLYLVCVLATLVITVDFLLFSPFLHRLSYYF